MKNEKSIIDMLVFSDELTPREKQQQEKDNARATITVEKMRKNEIK